MAKIKRYFTASLNKFSPLGMCDQSNFSVPHKDMIRQMEYNGAGLFDTGLLVYKKFADRPNLSNLAPKFFGDPTPVINARMAYYVDED